VKHFVVLFRTPQGALRSSSILLGEGSIKGGSAGTGFTLLSLKSHIAKSNKIERLTIDVGNGAAEKLSGPVAYFNVQNDPRGKRVMVDFSQTLNSKFEASHLKNAFARSPFVSKADLIFEPQSQTMSLVLDLKKPAAIRAQSFPGNSHQTAKLVLDLFEPGLIKRSPSRTK
jgi:hypothetical protein